MPIQDYSTDPDLNVQISGINIAEGCPPSGINNAIRQLMADVKEESAAKAEAITAASSALEAFAEEQAQKDEEQDAAIAGKLDKSGGTITGLLYLQYILRGVKNGMLALYGGDAWRSGAFVEINGPEAANPNVLSFCGADKTLLQGLSSGWAINGDRILTQKDLPVGTVLAFASNKAPDGFLLCNGAEVARATYAKLFDAIGTTYGAGNSSSTFALPNLTDRFIQGSGTAGTVKGAGLPNASGYFRSAYGSYDSGGVFSPSSSGGSHIGNLTSGGIGALWEVAYEMDLTKSNSIYGNSTTVQPPALTMRYYIKY